MQNILLIKGLKVFAYHGVRSHEKINGQNFVIDCEIKTHKLSGYDNDDIHNVVSYSEIIKEIVKVFTEKSYNLIEKTAEVLCEHLIRLFGDIDEIDLTVRKPEAPVSAEFGYVGIKISRKRSDYIE